MLILDFLASGTVRNKISFLSYQVHDISLQAKAGDLQIRLPYIHGFSTSNSRCHMTGTMGLRREFGIDEEKYGSWSAVSKTEQPICFIKKIMHKMVNCKCSQDNLCSLGPFFQRPLHLSPNVLHCFVLPNSTSVFSTRLHTCCNHGNILFIF